MPQTHRVDDEYEVDEQLKQAKKGDIIEVIPPNQEGYQRYLVIEEGGIKRASLQSEGGGLRRRKNRKSRKNRKNRKSRKSRKSRKNKRVVRKTRRRSRRHRRHRR